MVSGFKGSSDNDACQIIDLIEKVTAGQYKRCKKLYENPLYCKYLTPVE